MQKIKRSHLRVYCPRGIIVLPTPCYRLDVPCEGNFLSFLFKSLPTDELGVWVQGGPIYCSPFRSTVFDGKVFGGEYGLHSRARYGCNCFTLFFLSFLFVLCVFFYLFNFLIFFSARFSGAIDHVKHVTIDQSSQASQAKRLQIG